MARDMCSPGVDGCSLQAGNGMIVSDYTAPNGTRTVTSVGVESLAVTEQVTKPGEAQRTIPHSGKCETQPMPELAG